MRFTKVLAATAAALVLAASGCSSGGNTDSQSSQSEDSQSGDGPAGVVSEEGMEAVHALGSCEDIGELLEGSVPGLLDGMELVVNDAGADKPTICDWQGDDSLIAVEASPYEQLVPDADDIEVAGGVEVEATKFAEAGGTIYVVGEEPQTVVGVVPYGRAALQHSGLGDKMDQETAASLVEGLLGLEVLGLEVLGLEVLGLF